MSGIFLCCDCQLLQTSQAAAEQITVNIFTFIEFRKGLSGFALVTVNFPAAYTAAVLAFVFDESLYIF